MSALEISEQITIDAAAERVLRAFVDARDLAACWQVERSVTVPRPLGTYAVEWRTTDYRDEILGQLGALGHRAQPYFLRTHDGHEIDLVIEVASSRWAIECKLSTQPARRDLDRLSTLADAIRADRRILLSRSSEIVDTPNGIVCDLPWLLAHLGRLIDR